jgi:protein associated with RNAse G/E
MKIGDKVVLHSYKHDKSLHRVWKNEFVLENNDEMIIVANKKTRVVEDNGRFWYTKEPSVSFFYKKRWFNIIGILKKDDLCFYCNIASPILYDDEALKYIDYDLDIKVESDFSFNILDMNEYNRNQKRMNYSEDIKKILIQEMNELKVKVINRELPFNKEYVFEWYNKFLKLEVKV